MAAKLELPADKLFNKRVVECKFATLILAKILNYKNWKKFKTLRNIQEIYTNNYYTNIIPISDKF